MPRKVGNMSQIEGLLEAWTLATSKAKWGVQKVFHDVLSVAAEGKTTLIYGADYREGNPCLVNTVGAMLTSHVEVPLGGGQGVPYDYFRDIVRLFDQINKQFEATGVNPKPGYVDPLAAEILVKHFTPIPENPPLVSNVFDSDTPYYEISDQEMAQEMVNLFLMPSSPENDVHMRTEDDELHAMLPVIPRDQ